MGFFIRSRAADSAVFGPIWPNFELVRDVMDVLVTFKYEDDSIKNEGARVLTTFSPSSCKLVRVMYTLLHPTFI